MLPSKNVVNKPSEVSRHRFYGAFQMVLYHISSNPWTHSMFPPWQFCLRNCRVPCHCCWLLNPPLLVQCDSERVEREFVVTYFAGLLVISMLLFHAASAAIQLYQSVICSLNDGGIDFQCSTINNQCCGVAIDTLTVNQHTSCTSSCFTSTYNGRYDQWGENQR